MEEKWSKLAITSFILSLLPILLILINLFYSLITMDSSDKGLMMIILLLIFVAFGPIAYILSIIFSIISLKSIKKYGFRGKIFAWVALIISILVLVLFAIFVGGDFFKLWGGDFEMGH